MGVEREYIVLYGQKFPDNDWETFESIRYNGKKHDPDLPVINYVNQGMDGSDFWLGIVLAYADEYESLEAEIDTEIFPWYNAAFMDFYDNNEKYRQLPDVDCKLHIITRYH